ncbi:MAG: hypothetical protein AOA65_1866 [Candidatus Bathyarchaeota archaeon BA1]|nr:MAG: hypothetical protein AOA65_1866 [Candidatus Bathyarchaeota archaeon BA1]
MEKDADREKRPREIVKELVSRYISPKPKGISLKLHWGDRKSLINLKGDDLDQTIEYARVIDFTSFGYGVVEAYREAYGELREIPVSFRETVYRTDKVVMDLYPTGSVGTFDIFIDYK